MPEMTNNWAAVVDTLVSSAFQYGPFFFSIWFLYAFARWSYRNYRSILDNRRVDAKEREKHWTYFIGSTVFGCILVTISTAWWIFNKPNTYVFDGEISGFAESDRVSSPDVYIKEWLDRNTGQMQIYFVAIGSEPFGKGQNFPILVSHSGNDVSTPRRKSLSIEYDGRAHTRLTFSGDKLFSLTSPPPRGSPD
jgi:hypothetical protein